MQRYRQHKKNMKRHPEGEFILFKEFRDFQEHIKEQSDRRCAYTLDAMVVITYYEGIYEGPENEMKLTMAMVAAPTEEAWVKKLKEEAYEKYRTDAVFNRKVHQRFSTLMHLLSAKGVS